jgi:hypothetical protein
MLASVEEHARLVETARGSGPSVRAQAAVVDARTEPACGFVVLWGTNLGFVILPPALRRQPRLTPIPVG